MAAKVLSFLNGALNLASPPGNGHPVLLPNERP